MRLFRRSKVVAVVVTAFVSVLAVFCLYWAAPSPVTRENYDHIQNGMAKPQVIAILGRPDTERFRARGMDVPNTEIWTTDDFGLMINVVFDERGGVSNKIWFGPTRDEWRPPGFFSRLLSRLRGG